MLKGLILEVTGGGLLKENLNRDGLPWRETVGGTAAELRRAAGELAAQPRELLCLVETDRQEKIALEGGFFCIGYLNPQLPDERLSGCKILLEGFQEVDAPFLRNVHTRALGLPVQIAETEHLLIREMTLSDLEEVNELYRRNGSFQIEEAEETRGLTPQEEEEKVRAYIDYMYGLYQFGMWVVIEKNSGRLIGRAGFGIADYLDFSEVDLGYLMDRDYRRRGYAEEACRAVLAYGTRTLEFEQVAAYVEEENQKSQRLLEKLGFDRERIFRYHEKKLYRYIWKNKGETDA
ncbi:GNAT family N-acetyltransferase [Anaerosacchariphilus sp. NSJ-68]|uniref:GNAT family N-acetyltransferase n=2 Tax=Lachnospiraceae TaxID=186803 RepID=A0A923RLL7_9FIRM|nr:MULTISPECIES: GNAT family protein [Lachnospiraceae]MBC5659392.1 GNAT family N-acetyltransferase [Anaerosacchariphilus hominis]MBC5697058.1 GNAT family N-acetyltransferase [Roseburia difficilis]